MPKKERNPVFYDPNNFRWQWFKRTSKFLIFIISLIIIALIATIA